MRLRRHIDLLLDTLVLYLIIFSSQKEMVVFGFVINALSHAKDQKAKSVQSEITRHSFFEPGKSDLLDVADAPCGVNISPPSFIQTIKEKITSFEDHTKQPDDAAVNQEKAFQFVSDLYATLANQTTADRIRVLSDTPGFQIKIKLYDSDFLVTVLGRYNLSENAVKFFLSAHLLNEPSYKEYFTRVLWHEYWHAEVGQENIDCNFHEYGTRPALSNEEQSSLSGFINDGLARVNEIYSILNTRGQLSRANHKRLKELDRYCEDYMPQYYPIDLTDQQVKNFYKGGRIVTHQKMGLRNSLKIHTELSR